MALAGFIGCAPIKETAKVFWGSSTKALEKARRNALSKTYHCQFDQCFDAVLSLARKKTMINLQGYPEQSAAQPQLTTQDESVTEEKVSAKQTGDFFEVFMKDRKSGYLVVMGIDGSVDTTEVGIFFSLYSPGVIKIEISSLSSNAKRHVAQDIFGQLDLKFEPAI